MSAASSRPKAKTRWLNRTVLGIGLASLFSDWSHEIAVEMIAPASSEKAGAWSAADRSGSEAK